MTITVRPSTTAAQRTLHGRLRRGVEARGRLVEDDHRGIGQRDARDPDELPLTGREPHPSRLDVGVDPVGQRGRSARGRRSGPARAAPPRRRPQGRPSRTLSAIVPLNRWPSWGSITIRCRSEASVPSRRSTPPSAIEPALRVVLAREQLRERRLPCTGHADQRDLLAGLQPQRNVLDDGRVRVVAERDAAQLDRALGGKTVCARPLRDGALGLEQADELAERGEALAEVPEPLAEARDRVEELHQVEDVCSDRPLRDGAVPVHRGGDEQDGDQRDGLRQRDHREEADVHVRGALPGADLRPAARLVRLERPLLPAKGLNDPHAREPLLKRRQRLRHAVADREVDTACAVVEGPAGEGQDRQARRARRRPASATGSRALRS